MLSPDNEIIMILCVLSFCTFNNNGVVLFTIPVLLYKLAGDNSDIVPRESENRLKAFLLFPCQHSPLPEVIMYEVVPE